MCEALYRLGNGKSTPNAPSVFRYLRMAATIVLLRVIGGKVRRTSSQLPKTAILDAGWELKQTDTATSIITEGGGIGIPTHYLLPLSCLLP